MVVFRSFFHHTETLADMCERTFVILFCPSPHRQILLMVQVKKMLLRKLLFDLDKKLYQ